jgi:hypothetical protein
MFFRSAPFTSVFSRERGEAERSELISLKIHALLERSIRLALLQREKVRVPEVHRIEIYMALSQTFLLVIGDQGNKLSREHSATDPGFSSQFL